MNLNSFLALLLVLSPVLAADPGADKVGVTLYVAPGGDDGWSGKLPEPNSSRTDGPLATLVAARDALRKLGEPQSRGPAMVYARGGVYRMNAPFVLEARDSGATNAPVVYAAYPGEHPVISGGQVVRDWREIGQLWETTLPAVRDAKIYFRQLFVNGQRRQRARSPNAGYHRIAELLPGPMDAPSKRAVLRDRFQFRPGDLQPFTSLGDVELTLMHSWETSIHPLKAVDSKSNVVELLPHSRNGGASVTGKRRSAISSRTRSSCSTRRANGTSTGRAGCCVTGLCPASGSAKPRL